MSVGETTIELWRRAPAWRFGLIGAVVATILALVIGRGGQLSPNTNQSTLSGSGQTTVGSGPPSSGGLQCGPKGQAVVQAPIVVSSAGQVPSNVRGGAGPAQPQGIPASIQARFVQFSTQIDAARIEPRDGERCVKMKGALDKLEPSDYAYADCFQEGEKKLIAAQACSSDLENSEIRFERLTAAFAESRDDNSAERVEELARARKRMTPFDETRELWNLNDAMVSAGDNAIKAIADSDKRIAALKAAGTNSSQSTVELQKLAEAGKLTALDRARLSSRELDILRLSEEAKETLSESDKRLATLVESLAGNASSNEAARAQLIAALSALTEFDLQRATAAQQRSIEQARQTAGKFAVRDLVAETSNIVLDDAKPADYQRLRDLLLAVQRYGGQIQPGSSESQAINIARKADARLVRSDRRISNMHDIVQRVEQGGPAELGDDVLKVHNELERFDLARMTVEDMQVYRRLESARNITMATKSQQLTRDVPLFVSTSNDDELTQLALKRFRQGLGEAGFNLVSAEEQSAISMTLRRSEVAQKSVRFSGSVLNTAEVTVSISGKWTFAGTSISVPSAKGDAVGSDYQSLQREAIEEATGHLVDRFKKLTDAS